MSIHLRNGIYQIDFTVPGVPRVRESSGTTDKVKAQQLHDRMKAEAWERAKLGTKPRVKWAAAALRWLQEKADKRTLDDDEQRIAWLQERWGERFLDELTSEVIAETIDTGKADKSKATRNRYFALVRAIMRKAAGKWKMIEKAPYIELHKEPKGRVRYLTPEEARRLLDELPDHLRPVVEFALATGLRMSNITGLQWSWIDMERRHASIPGRVMKNGQPLPLPLNDIAMGVLTRLSAGWKHATHVFTYNKKPFHKANADGFKEALKRAGIADFRFHDLRHTWASWIVQNGGDVNMLRSAGGWQSAEMVARYAHLSSKQLADTAAIIDGVLAFKPKLVVNEK
jgi:integrase